MRLRSGGFLAVATLREADPPAEEPARAVAGEAHARFTRPRSVGSARAPGLVRAASVRSVELRSGPSGR